MHLGFESSFLAPKQSKQQRWRFRQPPTYLSLLKFVRYEEEMEIWKPKWEAYKKTDSYKEFCLAKQDTAGTVPVLPVLVVAPGAFRSHIQWEGSGTLQGAWAQFPMARWKTHTCGMTWARWSVKAEQINQPMSKSTHTHRHTQTHTHTCIYI